MHQQLHCVVTGCCSCTHCHKSFISSRKCLLPDIPPHPQSTSLIVLPTHCVFLCLFNDSVLTTDVKYKESGRWVPTFSRKSLIIDSLRAGRYGNRIPVGARFSAPVQTGPGAHPASYTLGPDLCLGVKAAGAWR